MSDQVKKEDINHTLLQKHYDYKYNKQLEEMEIKRAEHIKRRDFVEQSLSHLIEIQDTIKQHLVESGEYSYPLKEDIEFEHIDEILSHPSYPEFRRFWRLMVVDADFDVAKKCNKEELVRKHLPDPYDKYQPNKYCCNIVASAIHFKLDARLTQSDDEIETMQEESMMIFERRLPRVFNKLLKKK